MVMHAFTIRYSYDDFWDGITVSQSAYFARNILDLFCRPQVKTTMLGLC